MKRIRDRRKFSFLVLFAVIAAISACDGGSTASDGNADVERYADLPACDSSCMGGTVHVRSLDADYFCNGEIWVLRDEKPAECDSGGIMTDRRNGRTYRCADWGHGVWMVDNLNLGQFGDDSRASATIWLEARKSCEEGDTTCPGGARYAYLTAVLIDTTYRRTNVLDMLGSPHRGLCPMGWHIPTKEEFLAAFGDDEALDRLWLSLKDPAIVAFFQSEVWTAGDVYCSKKLSGGTDVQVEMEWGEVECRSANGYAERRLRCVQD